MKWSDSINIEIKDASKETVLSMGGEHRFCEFCHEGIKGYFSVYISSFTEAQHSVLLEEIMKDIENRVTTAREKWLHKT